MENFLLYSYILALAIVSVYGFHRYYMVFLFRKHKDKKFLPKDKFRKLPKVTIQLPIFNEKYVIERLIDSISRIKYPKNLLEIQVLDDSTDDTVILAENKCIEQQKKGFNIKYIHRTDRTGYKAGALENGLATAEGEYIAIFDADFLPEPDFLEKTIHYFTDNNIGMVQARWDHINRDYSLLTECQSILLDGHFMVEQTARSRSGRFFNFNGTAGMWRKQAIHDAGGWQHDTITEDMDLSYRAQLKGWKFVYLPDVTVPSELPVEMSAFKAQQFRWAKGSIEVFLKLISIIVKANIPLKQKVEAFFHMGSNFAWLLMGYVAIVMPLNIVIRYKVGFMPIFLMDIPIFVLASASVVVFYLFSEYMVLKETLSVQHRSILTTMLYLPMALAIGIGIGINNFKAVTQAVFKVVTPFNRTPKYNVNADKTGASSKIKANVYRIKKIDWVIVIEMVMGLYFTLVILFMLEKEQFFTVPFLMLFQLGFLYTAIMSIYNFSFSFNFKKAEK